MTKYLHFSTKFCLSRLTLILLFRRAKANNKHHLVTRMWFTRVSSPVCTRLITDRLLGLSACTLPGLAFLGQVVLTRIAATFSRLNSHLFREFGRCFHIQLVFLLDERIALAKTKYVYVKHCDEWAVKTILAFVFFKDGSKVQKKGTAIRTVAHCYRLARRAVE